MTDRIYSERDARAILTRLKPRALFRAMEATTEESPWHREANVLVHTEMVLEEYIRFTNEAVGKEWDYFDYLGAISCVWHDAGKPPSMVVKHTNERGHYKAFHGHEIVSARLFEDFYMSNPEERKYAELRVADVFTVGWMIQNHMPWSSTRDDHLKRIKATASRFGVYEAYKRALAADQHGRIADDQEAKLAAADEWLQKLDGVYVDDMVQKASVEPSAIAKDQPRLVLAVGPSGAGKSTHFAMAYEKNGYVKFSLDSLRHEFYDSVDYAAAYAMSTEDSKFMEKANARFMQHVRAGENIFVDNTNLSPKRRAFYIMEARRRGYHVSADVFLTSLYTVVIRQKTRGDKDVPEGAVKQQYMSVHLPDIGEVDGIRIVSS